MTQYMLSVMTTKDDAPPERAVMEKTFADVDAFNKKVMAAGSWVFGGGLEVISDANVVDGTGSEVVTTDGPFGESKEWIGGFWVIEAPDREAALALAAEASVACRGRVELRPFQADDDIDAALKASGQKD